MTNSREMYRPRFAAVQRVLPAIAAALLLAPFTSTALAEEPGSPAETGLADVPVPTAAATDDGWRFNVTPYLWLPSVDVTLGIDDTPAAVDGDSGDFDFLEALGFAALVCGEARKDKFGLLYDVQYLHLNQDGETSGPLARDTDASFTIADATLALQYRVVDRPTFTLDALAGARGVYAKVELDIEPGPGGVLGFDGDESEWWIDPIVGAKCRWRFANRWALNAYGDIGGFGVGSDLTYQALGTVSYSVSEHFALHLGYRAFAVDFEDGDFEFDVTLHGPLIGATFSF